MNLLLRPMWWLISALSGEADGEHRGFTIHKALLHMFGAAWWNHSLVYRIYRWQLVALTLFQSVCLAYNPVTTPINSSETFTTTVKNLVSLLTFYACFFKLYVLLLSRERLEGLITSCEALPQDGALLPGLRLVTTYGLVIATTAVGFCFNFLDPESPYDGLLYDENFPWDETHGWGLISALLVQLLAAQTAWALHWMEDTLPTVVVYKLEVQVKKLNYMLREVGSGTTDDLRLLREAVQLHLTLMRNINFLNSTYKVIFMFQNTYLVIHSCIVVYCVVKVEGYSYLITSLVPMMISAYFQLFMYCRTGQKITSMMEEVSSCCYDNKWYETSPKVRRVLLLIMLYAKKPVLFQAYGIAAALYSTYLKSVQESVSYFIFLRTVDSKISLANKLQ